MMTRDIIRCPYCKTQLFSLTSIHRLIGKWVHCARCGAEFVAKFGVSKK